MRLHVAVLVALLTVASVVTLAHADGKSMCVALRVEAQCRVSVEHVRASTRAPEAHPTIPYPLPARTADLPMVEDTAPLHLAPASEAHRLAVLYKHPDLPPTHPHVGHVFADPRVKYAGGIYGDHTEGEVYAHVESPQGSHFHASDSDVEMLWVPPGTDIIDVYCHNTSAAPQSFRLSLQRKYTAQADDGIEMRVEESVGPPERTLNIIFLAGGYTLEQKDMFWRNVTALKYLLPDPDVDRAVPPEARVNSEAIHSQHKTTPFDRYWPFFNVYSIFQPSAQAGASRPKYGLNVDNNLGCYHPASVERGVSCNIWKTLALADVAPIDVNAFPDRSIIIVVVNTHIYGGSGIYRKGRMHIAHFFNGYNLDDLFMREKMTSLMNHELGHSFGNLFDEYDVGISEPANRELQNCQYPSPTGGTPTDPSWQHWINIVTTQRDWYNYYTANNTFTAVDGQGQNMWTVDATPVVVCGYTNYFKPNEYCMMHRLNNYFMCPVCRERATMTIMETQFDYSWPRLPMRDPITIIPKNGGDADASTFDSVIVLHLPASLTYGNSFDVTWRDDTTGRELIPARTSECPQCVVLSRNEFQNWPVGQVVNVTVTIVDHTRFISDSMRGQVANLLQTTTFSFKVVENLNDAGVNVTKAPPIINSRGNWGRHRYDNYSFYTQCLYTPGEPDPMCNMTFSSKQYESPLDVGGFISQYDKWVLYVAGGLGLVFLLLWVWAMNYYKKESGRVVRPIFKTQFTAGIQFIRNIMKMASVLFMVASLGVIGLAIWFYMRTTALGKIVVVIGVVVAIGMYIIAFIGFWAISYRSKKLLLVNGGVLIFSFLVMGGLVALVITVGKDIKEDDSFWTNQLETLWKSLVKDDPERACALQGMLQCSGFFIACDSVIGSTVYCPRDCERTNEMFAEPCKAMLQRYISDNYQTLLIIMAAGAGMMFVGVVFNFIYYVRLKQMKKAIRDHNDKRIHRVASVNPATDGQVRKCKALFILKTLDHGDTKLLMKEFERIDADGNGQLDRAEFVYFFKKALCYRPTNEEIDEIFRVADIDGDGTISMAEFLAIFNPQMAQELRAEVQQRHAKRTNESKQALLRRSADISYLEDDQRAAEVRRRASMAFGNTGLFEEEMRGQGKLGTDSYRARLIRFYQKYAPEKMAVIDQALSKFRGHEEEMMQKLVEKYGPEPPAPVRPQQAAQKQPAVVAVIIASPQKAQPSAPSFNAVAPPPGPGYGAPPAAASVTRSPYYERLVRFYQQYNPAQIDGADRVLTQYHGREDQLFDALVKKYGPEPHVEI